MSIFFKDREGNTPLSEEERKGLKAKLIKTHGELDTLEQKNILKGLVWLRSKSNDEILNISFAQRLHKELFKDVWSWAGVFRKSDKNIGIDFKFISIELHKLLEDASYWSENQTFENVEILARFHHRLVQIHPFPNGNGRWSRIYTDSFAKKMNSISLTWYTDLPQDERRRLYIHALKNADLRKYDEIVKFFRNMREYLK